MTEGEEDSKQPTAKRQRRVGQRSRSGVAMQPMSLSTTAAMESGNLKVLSKHDEKWNSMLEKLTAYKAEHGNTLVPQCYAKDTKLGRWVHYQRGTNRNRFSRSDGWSVRRWRNPCCTCVVPYISYLPPES